MINLYLTLNSTNKIKVTVQRDGDDCLTTIPNYAVN